MSDELKSPTCCECAWMAGLVPVSDCFTVSEGYCANCHLDVLVSATSDWKRPNVIGVDWD